ncbi:MAG TPA: SCP2 sterol-binding domain-containing protein [Thermoanaerobaculia bacterium]|nr:SCP2 sterol-binding domain-containing protein [Thermoanaerobaculia bacterium]
MSALVEHPTVRKYETTPHPARKEELSSAWLRELALACGADDVGFVEIERPSIAGERAEVERVFPGARSLIGIVRRMGREEVRSPARSLANLEFHHTTDEVNDIGRRLVAALEREGVRALNTASGFPMEADRWGTRNWIVSHKPVAEAAGLGRMGIHRNVIHPRFGTFILLGTVVIEAKVDVYSQPLDYNPCLECKLCVAACPTGAIGADGAFDFSACYTHNYREFMGGFIDWVETVAGSGSAAEYRKRVADTETVSMWQSLAFGPNYKAAYCLSVCPAGEDVIGPFLADRPKFLQTIVKPLQEKEETVYVLPNSDAEAHVARRFPSKKSKRVSNGLRSPSVASFLRGLRLTFQRERAGDLDATYHFTFTGAEELEATVVIRNKRLEVMPGRVGKADLRITADAAAWLRFIRKETSIIWPLLRRMIRIQGPPRLLLAFGRCFGA